MKIRLIPPALMLLANVTVARAGSDFAFGFDGSDLATTPHSPIFHQIEATDKLTIEAWINVANDPQGWMMQRRWR